MEEEKENNRRRRRRFTVEQKRNILAESESLGQSIAMVARRHGLLPTQLYRWRHAMTEAANEGLKHGEKVYSARDVKALGERVASLEKALGCSTLTNDILEKTVRIAVEKKY